MSSLQTMKIRGLDVIGQQGTTPLSINQFTTRPLTVTHTYTHSLLPYKTSQHLLYFIPAEVPCEKPIMSDLCLGFSKTDSIAETQQRSR